MKKIITYLVLTFTSSTVFWFLIISAGHIRAGGGLYALGLMWCPGISALVTTLVFQHNIRGLGWGIGRVRYVVLAYALPLAYTAVTYGAVWFVGLGAFTIENLPTGQPLLRFLIINMTFVFLLGALLPALGEEIGWRGLLVPELAKLTTFTNTGLISGLIWAIWHFPLILFSDYNSGAPALYALSCFSVMIVGVGFALAWLRIRSGSLWTAAVMHASHNLFIQAIFGPLTKNTGMTKYVTGEFGVALAFVGIVIGAIFWRARPPTLPSKKCLG